MPCSWILSGTLGVCRPILRLRLQNVLLDIRMKCKPVFRKQREADDQHQNDKKSQLEYKTKRNLSTKAEPHYHLREVTHWLSVGGLFVSFESETIVQYIHRHFSMPEADLKGQGR